MTEVLAGSPLVRAVGLALVQFLWQGALIGACTALILMALRRSTAQARYVVACLGLALMLVAPIVTATGYLRETPTAAGISQVALQAPPATTHLAVQPSGAGPMSASETRAMGQFRERIERWLPLVVMTWVAGVLVLALHLFRGWVRLWRIRRGATPLRGNGWPEAARLVAARLGLTRSVQLAGSAMVEVPAVIGWLRPIILLPASALAGLSPVELEAILAHELAHVRRGDYFVNVIQCVVEVLLFYHPAVWWVSGQIRREREHCCDDIAASLSPDRVTYARALASLEELRGEAPRLAMAASGSDLLNRIRRLVEPGSASGPRWSGGFMMGVVLTVLLFAATGQIRSMPAGHDQSTASIAEAIAAPLDRVAEVPAPVAPRPAPRAVPVRTAPRAQGVTTAPPRDPRPPAAGQMLGEVSDPSGGVIPGVTITVTSVATRAFWTAVTNSGGRFHFANLPAGAYDLTATLAGFRTFKATVQVASNETLSAGIRLRLGALSETVTVTVPPSSSGSAPILPVARVEAPRTLIPEDQITPISAPDPNRPVRVGGNIREPKKIKHVDPVYPQIAATAQVNGYVIIEAIIGKDGAVRDARVVKSHPLLDDAALEAVRQWVYSPTELNGAPIEVVMTVTVMFSLK
jgi:TonB family protein